MSYTPCQVLTHMETQRLLWSQRGPQLCLASDSEKPIYIQGRREGCISEAQMDVTSSQSEPLGRAVSILVEGST